MKYHLSAAISIVVFLLLGICLSSTYAKDYEIMGQEAEDEGKFREALTHYMSALESTSEESSGLREKIIKLVQKIEPPPAIPKEAKRHMARGRAAVKTAKDEQGFLQAAKEFREALRAAPWLSEGYFNLGFVLDKAGKYDEAIRNLKFYLLASTDAEDVSEVEDLIYEIEYRKEEAQRAKTEEREKLARRKEEMLGRLEGTWMDKLIIGGKLDLEIFYQLTHTGHSAFEISYSYFRNYDPDGEFIPPQKHYIKLSVEGNKLRGTEYSQTSPRTGKCKHHPVVERAVSGSISKDWRTISLVRASFYKYWDPFKCRWRNVTENREVMLKIVLEKK